MDRVDADIIVFIIIMILSLSMIYFLSVCFDSKIVNEKTNDNLSDNMINISHSQNITNSISNYLIQFNQDDNLNKLSLENAKNNYHIIKVKGNVNEVSAIIIRKLDVSYRYSYIWGMGSGYKVPNEYLGIGVYQTDIDQYNICIMTKKLGEKIENIDSNGVHYMEQQNDSISYIF
jgi:hypothetical protein